MAWEEYERLHPDVRHEYVDGHLLVNPRPRLLHQVMLRRITNALEAALPEGYRAVNEWAWKPGADEWAPDVMVCELTPGDGPNPVRFTRTPLLIVEVLSSNRSADLVKKLYRYAEAGLPHFWLADPEGPSVEAFALAEASYHEVVGAAGDETADFDLGVITVTLRPADLIR